MNRFELITRAAGHISKYPYQYEFQATYVPPRLVGRDIACMLGRMGVIAGIEPYTDVAFLAPAFVGSTDRHFYGEIALIMRVEPGTHCTNAKFQNAPVVARAMKIFAKRFEGIPSDVREIFNKYNKIGAVVSEF